MIRVNSLQIKFSNMAGWVGEYLAIILASSKYLLIDSCIGSY